MRGIPFIIKIEENYNIEMFDWKSKVKVNVKVKVKIKVRGSIHDKLRAKIVIYV